MRIVVSHVRAGMASAKFWKVLTIWAICLFYVLFQGGRTSIMLFVMISMLVVYWAIGGLTSIKGITGTRDFEGEHGHMMQAGDQVNVKLRLKLPRFMPFPYIIIKEVLKRHNGESWSFEESIIPGLRSGTVLSFRTPPMERGRYSFAEIRCSSKDIFGLIEHHSQFTVPSELLVLPKTTFIPHWQLFNRNSSMSGPETAISYSRKETNQINGVRDYVYGDRISRIHWNATAKTGIWKSKEFEHESLPKTMLVIDALASNYNGSERFELAVSTAASLLEYATRERMSVGLCTLGANVKGFIPAKSYNDRQRMMHHLVDVDIEGSGSLISKLDSTKNLFPKSAFFVLITPLKREQVEDVMKWAQRQGMYPTHIQISDASALDSNHNAKQSTLHNKLAHSTVVTSLSQLPSVIGGGRNS